MIKINLLPFRAAKKREDVKRQISIYILVVVLVGLATGYLTWYFFGKVAKLEAEKKVKDKELASYAAITAEIAERQKRIKEIETKLKVIEGLKEGKTGPVKLLDDLSTAIPKGKLWISSFAEKGGVLNLSGTAEDNPTVALFMVNLEKTGSIKSVDLKSATTKEMKSISLTDFNLQCRTTIHKEPEKPKAAPKRRR